MTESLDQITITAPDDWHIHLRDDDALAVTVPHVARQFKRAIVMPNLVPPVTNAELALAYKQRILDHGSQEHPFEPLMVLYLTDNTDDSGVTAIENIYPAIEAMQETGMKLLIHGEVTDEHVDIFEREAEFIDRTMAPLVKRFPDLKVVFEHITTEQAAQFVEASSGNVAATITAHHLMFNRNHMLAGGIRPHYYCLPILKRATHQQALMKAAASGNPKFFLGTDSAPHARSKKENPCGCAGAYTAYTALELYATAFEQAGALDKFEAFASFNGPDFYGLPRNTGTVTLQKHKWQVPSHFDYAGEKLTPLLAGEMLNWQIKL